MAPNIFLTVSLKKWKLYISQRLIWGILGCPILACSPDFYTPVCGSDGVSYQSECHLNQAACQQADDPESPLVEKAYDGICPDSCPTGMFICEDKVGRRLIKGCGWKICIALTNEIEKKNYRFEEEDRRAKLIISQFDTFLLFSTVLNEIKFS